MALIEANLRAGCVRVVLFFAFSLLYCCCFSNQLVNSCGMFNGYKAEPTINRADDVFDVDADDNVNVVVFNDDDVDGFNVRCSVGIRVVYLLLINVLVRWFLA